MLEKIGEKSMMPLVLKGFGLLRDPDTLEFIGFAPIYDSGTSLCYNRNARQFDRYESKPFCTDCEKQLALVTSLEWFSPEKPEAEIILFGAEDIVTQSLEFTPDEYEDNPVAGQG